MNSPNSSGTYPGKILLFGEYSVIYGSHAILVPYRKVHAELSSGDRSPETMESNRLLSEYYNYLKSIQGQLFNKLDLEKLGSDIEDGLYIRSTIPPRYGLGSSGAICAAIFDLYKVSGIKDNRELQELFSLMESWFHGKSSGIDPLCSLYNEIIVIRGNDFIRPGQVLNFPLRMFLIDTGITSTTAPLVKYFGERMRNRQFAEDFRSEYIPVVNRAVEQILKGRLSPDTVSYLSAAQQKYFRQMIPGAFSSIWQKGLESGMYYLKICGSGGGGMLLGFTTNMEKTSGYLKVNFDITAIPFKVEST